MVQFAVNRYENSQSEVPSDILLWYADYFDVSLDYIYGRCDSPQGKLYDFQPKVWQDNAQMQAFVEMCFDPSSPANARLKETPMEYLGIWESIYNPNFNYGEFATIKSKAGLNNFKISVKEFVARTNAIGLQAKAGRYGGTYAHKDIAFEFGMWISPEFKIYLVKELQRLKDEEQKQLGWSAKRELAKINYRIHTDAIKENLIPTELTPTQISYVYANEADVLYGKYKRCIDCRRNTTV